MFRVNIKCGEMCPNFFGLAYHDHEASEGVYFVVPLNHIVAWWRWIKVKLKITKCGDAAYDAGYRQGYFAAMKTAVGWDNGSGG